MMLSCLFKGYGKSNKIGKENRVDSIGGKE